MRCATARELLTEYLESRLEERLQQEVGRHLMDCRRCAQELETLQIAVGALHELTPEPAPPGFAEGVSRRLHSPASPWTPRYWRLSWKPAAWVAPALAASAVVAMAIWLLPQQFSTEKARVAKMPEQVRQYTAPPAAPGQPSPEASPPQQGPALGSALPGGPVYSPRSAVPALPPAEAATKPSEVLPKSGPSAPPSAELFARNGPDGGIQNGALGAPGTPRDHETASKVNASGDIALGQARGLQAPAGAAGPAGPTAAPAPHAEYDEGSKPSLPTMSENRLSVPSPSAILPAVTASVTDGPAPKVRLALLRALNERATGEEFVTRRVEPAAAAGKAEPELEPAEVSDAKWPGLVTVRITAPPAVAGHYLLALPAQERLGKDTDRVLTRAYERRRIREILADLSSASGLVILAPDPGLALLDLRLRDTTVDQALSLIASSRNEVVFADGAARTLLSARPAAGRVR